MSKRPVHLVSRAAPAFGRGRTKAVAGLIVLVALSAVPLLQGSGVAAAATGRGAGRKAATRSCGSVGIQGSPSYDLEIVKGSPSCATVRSIAKGYGHPISKKPRYFCGTQAYECEYSIYPEGWRCGGLFMGYFECWRGANPPTQATKAFEGVPSSARRWRPRALELAARRPPCTKRALTKGLRRSGLRGYIDHDTFRCAGHFAYAGVIVDDNEVTVLFHVVHRHWRSASRAHYCENGSVPQQIYQPACETN